MSEVALSPLDAAFLHVESERTPMHIGSVAIFEAAKLLDDAGELRLDDIRALISSRLHLVPKLRQTAHAGLLGEAPPVWLDDPDFDITNHVVALSLDAPGTEDVLKQVCGELMSVPLDRIRPLWELVFVQGLGGDRVALIERLHHSMADGLAATELATVLLDLGPDVPHAEGEAWVGAEPDSVWRAGVDDIIRLGRLPLRATAWGLWGVAHPIRRGRRLLRFGRAAAGLFGPRLIAPSSSLNPQIGSKRSVEFVRLPFDVVQAVAQYAEAKINDVVLTLVAGGLHELLAARDELNETSEIQVLAPVGLSNGTGGTLGNSVSAYFVRLPVGIDDVRLVLEKIVAQTRAEKQHHHELVPSAFLRLLEPLPQHVLAVVTGLVQRQPLFNLIVTNVPGPPIPLYAMGSRLLEAFPLVPLAGNQSMGVAVLSYEGQLTLGILSDPDTCQNVDAFCRGVHTSLSDLRRSLDMCGDGSRVVLT